jgi:polyisoprenoid-binding protein YceI
MTNTQTATIDRTATGGAVSTWRIDPSHSTVEFAVKHMMISSTKGRFSDFSGEINLDENDLANSTVNVSINVVSIDTHDEKRDEHLRSADFFDAENHPVMTFVSKQVRPKGDDEFEVVGDLTIRGITREVVLKAEREGMGTSPWGNEVAAYTAKTEIDRKDFGLVWNVALETGGILVGDKVKLNLEIEAIKQA